MAERAREEVQQENHLCGPDLSSTSISAAPGGGGSVLQSLLPVLIKLNKSGEFRSTCKQPGMGPGDVTTPRGEMTDEAAHRIILTDQIRPQTTGGGSSSAELHRHLPQLHIYLNKPTLQSGTKHR
ncbi:unnamed protein product [Pleuronectes platessa]|uniref:Uncharacterized protein n=1 Tax=Pleuronectes platessa TaxID=8262 RepID=A0A9N7UKV3_PLEPL|nr:unnamed protein product [Pleuronectes platessa]